MERDWGGGGYRPYFDPDYESLPERINPPRVCVDNQTYNDCTLVKVDSANKHGILLEMVQVLTDLDLVISKSYISSDGGWFMDVFHVTDQFGRKLSDRSLISYIQQSLISRRMRSGTESVKTCLGRVVAAPEKSAASPSSEHTALELTGTDRPGLLSELSAVLVEHECHVVSGQAWSHNSRVACILYLGTQPTGGPMSDGSRLSELEVQLEHVMAAHHGPRERWRVTLRAVRPAASQVHTERRLHQLMHEDRDFEEGEEAVGNSRAAAGKMAAKVSIDSCEEKGYSVVSIRSKDRPKLLFDTVCTLTDMEYVVFHATVGSQGPVAVQEYFIRRMDGRPLDSEAERGRVARCLVAAIERRVSQGSRLKICTPDRIGLLSDVTRVFRENGLSMTGADIGMRGERAVGTFYVTDASGGEVDLRTVDSVREDIGGPVRLELENSPPWPSVRSNSEPPTGGSATNERPRFSLGSLLWSQIGRLSNNFGSIRS